MMMMMMMCVFFRDETLFCPVFLLPFFEFFEGEYGVTHLRVLIPYSNLAL